MRPRLLALRVASLGFGALGSALLGCAGEGPSPSLPRNLAPGAVAHVDDVALEESLITAVAAAQGLTPAASLDALVKDAVAAIAARKRGLDTRPSLQRAVRSALARATVRRIEADALAAGPPTDDEVRAMSQLRWTEVDLPEQRLVVHAVVLTERGKSAEADPEGHTLARRIADAVAGAPADRFEELASDIPTGGRKVRIEHLAPFVADGRISAGGTGSFDKAFVAAAFALPGVGATTSPVASPFGWHVIRLLAVHAPRVMVFEERRVFFREAILKKRTKEAYESTLTALRQRRPTDLDPAADMLLGSLTAP